MHPLIRAFVCSFVAVSTTGVQAEQFRQEGPERGSAYRSAVLPGTGKLKMTGDIASALVSGVDRFLLREIDRSAGERSRRWNRDLSSPPSYDRSVAANRNRLAKIIGAHDSRESGGLELVTRPGEPANVARGSGFVVHAVRWPAVRGVFGEGLLLVPSTSKAIADIIALPDADQSPEEITGVVAGVSPQSQFARRLAESGCRVLVPTLIDRASTHSATERGQRKTRLSHREFLYRPAFELGRHIIGYEVQKVLAAVDWFARESGERDPKIGVVGYGEGGLLALYAGALDERIDVTCVSGYFDSRQRVWQEPLYRNVFGLLHEFGDAELASLVAPRALIVEASVGPEVVVPPGTGGGPGRITTPDPAAVEKELARARSLTRGLEPAPRLELIRSGDGTGPFGSSEALLRLLDNLVPGSKLAASGGRPILSGVGVDRHERLHRQFRQIEEDTQRLLQESAYVRREFWKKADRRSRSVERWIDSTKWYREYFYNEVIGRFDLELVAPNVRTRQVYDEPKYVGYEVVMDVFPDVIGYGILLLPKSIGDGERRPVVVCQHGLEGRPVHVADPSVSHPAYHQFACKLAERGCIAYAPQNLYIFGDRFRTLQRKANSIKKTLFSVIVPQHQQAVDWLASLPSVDPERIAFYGLSYGGKTAMRVPPLVERYALAICSGDFNEWIWKNASTRSPYSYVATGEYEIFEFDLGMTFNYAEMAGLIAPRPFMVERGHRDGVAPDETVAYEFAKVRLLYADLKIPERVEIEYFDGPHTIHGVGTFDFLRRHLRWPKPE